MNKHHYLHLLELGIIICLFAYVAFLGRAEVQSSPTLSTSFEEPPSLSGELDDLQDIVNDLENLGCKIIHLTEGWIYFEVNNYTEFRRIAYNSKVVFLTYFAEIRRVDMYVIFNGITVLCRHYL